MLFTTIFPLLKLKNIISWHLFFQVISQIPILFVVEKMQTYWPLTDWLKLWGDDTISVGFACFHFLSRDLEDTLVGWAVDAAMMTVHNLLLLLPLIRRVDEIPFVFWKPNGILMTVSWKPHAEPDLKGRWTKECCCSR